MRFLGRLLSAPAHACSSNTLFCISFFIQQTELAFERDAVFVFVIQVSKGLKLLARLVRLLSPQQLEDLIVQLMRVMPLVATEATGLKLSEEAENLVKRPLCGAIKSALDRMPFVQPLNIVRRVKANMPNDVTMAQAVWGAVRHGVEGGWESTMRSRPSFHRPSFFAA